MKIYSDKKKSLKSILKALLITLGALLILAIINLITINLFQRYFVPHILVAPALFLLAYLYRGFMHIFLPVIIYEDAYFKYFNVVWYYKYSWDKISHFSVQEDLICLFSTSGRQLEKIGIDEFSDNDRKNLLSVLKERNLLK